MPIEYRRRITHKRKNLVNYSFTRFLFYLGSGNRTRTCDLWVMSPTSYQLLHPALFGNTKVVYYSGKTNSGCEIILNKA